MVRASCGRRNSLRERIIGAGLKGARDKPSTTLRRTRWTDASRLPRPSADVQHSRPPARARNQLTHAPCARPAHDVLCARCD